LFRRNRSSSAIQVGVHFVFITDDPFTGFIQFPSKMCADHSLTGYVQFPSNFLVASVFSSTHRFHPVFVQSLRTIHCLIQCAQMIHFHPFCSLLIQFSSVFRFRPFFIQSVRRSCIHRFHPVSIQFPRTIHFFIRCAQMIHFHPFSGFIQFSSKMCADPLFIQFSSSFQVSSNFYPFLFIFRFHPVFIQFVISSISGLSKSAHLCFSSTFYPM